MLRRFTGQSRWFRRSSIIRLEAETKFCARFGLLVKMHHAKVGSVGTVSHASDHFSSKPGKYDMPPEPVTHVATITRRKINLRPIYAKHRLPGTDFTRYFDLDKGSSVLGFSTCMVTFTSRMFSPPCNDNAFSMGVDYRKAPDPRLCNHPLLSTKPVHLPPDLESSSNNQPWPCEGPRSPNRTLLRSSVQHLSPVKSSSKQAGLREN